MVWRENREGCWLIDQVWEDEDGDVEEESGEEGGDGAEGDDEFGGFDLPALNDCGGPEEDLPDDEELDEWSAAEDFLVCVPVEADSFGREPVCFKDDEGAEHAENEGAADMGLSDFGDFSCGGDDEEDREPHEVDAETEADWACEEVDECWPACELDPCCVEAVCSHRGLDFEDALEECVEGEFWVGVEAS